MKRLFTRKSILILLAGTAPLATVATCSGDSYAGSGYLFSTNPTFVGDAYDYVFGHDDDDDDD